jgi:hypothetical protein
VPKCPFQFLRCLPPEAYSHFSYSHCLFFTWLTRFLTLLQHCITYTIQLHVRCSSHVTPSCCPPYRCSIVRHIRFSVDSLHGLAQFLISISAVLEPSVFGSIEKIMENSVSCLTLLVAPTTWPHDVTRLAGQSATTHCLQVTVFTTLAETRYRGTSTSRQWPKTSVIQICT